MTDHLNFEVEKYKLSNGLTVLLHENHDIPIVAVNLWYYVGSANEVKGKTGFAHLFEHMMFQGSKNVEKEMHFKYIQEAGGSLNGSTSFDRTNYYETLPSTNLELALWLESDRMGFLLESLTEEKLKNQKEVVMNERRQRYDNQPYGRAWEILFSKIFPETHPYSWPTIGWMQDIEKFNIKDVTDFFKKYYSPDNASIVIAGDVNSQNALQLADKYFSDIKPNNENIKLDDNFNYIVKPQVVKHFEDVQLPRLYLAWRSVKSYDNNEAELEIISEILTGSKNSRLYKSLVFEKQILQDISSFQYSSNLDGLFIIVATLKKGSDINEAKTEIMKTLDNIKSDVSEDEFTKARNSIKASFTYSLQNLTTLANHFNHYNFYLNEPNYFAQDIARLDNSSIKEVMKTANDFLDENFIELQILPEELKK